MRGVDSPAAGELLLRLLAAVDGATVVDRETFLKVCMRPLSDENE